MKRMTEPRYVTILDLAKHLWAKDPARGPAWVAEHESYSGADFDAVGLPIMGGCAVCEATVAAYNACPSKSGYLKCAGGCIEGDGWYDVANCAEDVFGKEAR